MSIVGEADWMIAVMKYLHDCDQAFPDRLQESLGLTQRNANNLFSFFGLKRMGKTIATEMQPEPE